MENEQQEMLLSNVSKEFAAKNLRDAGSQALGLASLIHTIDSKEKLQVALINTLSEVIGRFTIAYKVATNDKDSWMHNLFLSVTKRIEKMDFEAKIQKFK